MLDLPESRVEACTHKVTYRRMIDAVTASRATGLKIYKCPLAAHFHLTKNELMNALIKGEN